MAYDYALVHLKYTIPLAGILTLILRPLLTKLDIAKILAIITIAFTATLPWDSYLIHQGVWTYPADAIIGPKLFRIPAEELFFFVIQTYITSLIYILVNKSVLHAQYLTNRSDTSPGERWAKFMVQGFLSFLVGLGAFLLAKGGRGTYLGLILIWAGPFALLTWSLSGYFMIKLPTFNIACPILVPTIYLWIVDELALGRGTWSIGSGTKLGWCLFGSLELEEAVFFFATNSLIVFGLVGFDRAMAVISTFPEMFPTTPATITPRILGKAILAKADGYDMDRVLGIREAIARLKRKSRSFYLASSVFPGRLRIDLIFLYSFCRVADDLVDDAKTEAEALEWIGKLSEFVSLVYADIETGSYGSDKVRMFVEANFPPSTHFAFKQLPVNILPKEPIYELLEGFKMDLKFGHTADGQGSHLPGKFPIRNEADLKLYASRVASTVGELCLWLVFHHCPTKLPMDTQKTLVAASQTMGQALQYVNIARDISTDAEMERVYLPTNWLKEEDMTPRDVIKAPRRVVIDSLRERLLKLAFREYDRSRSTMDLLPRDVRGPLIVAVESYMEIGRVLREGKGVPSSKKPGRATVPKTRRLWVAWKVLSQQ